MTDPVRAATPEVLGIERFRGKPDSPEALREVAKEFEGLLIGQLLESIRTASGGWLGEEDSAAGGLMADMGRQQLARALAAGGGLGLADLIVAGLSRGRQSEGPEDPGGAASGRDAQSAGRSSELHRDKVAIIDGSAFRDGIPRSAGLEPAAGKHQPMEDNDQ